MNNIDNRYGPRYNTLREYENLINELRVEDGYTIKDLSKLCNCNKSAMQGLSQGIISPTYVYSGKTKPFVKKLCMLFNVKFAQLFPFEMCFIKEEEYLTDWQMYFFLTGDYTKKISNCNDVSFYDLCALKKLLHKAIASLDDDRQQQILKFRFWDGYTLDQVANIMHVTRERIRQIEAKALRLLREKSNRYNRRLQSYFEVL